MYIVAIAWIYVVLMMSIVEQSFVAGIMTFLMYGVLPLLIILYLMRAAQRKPKRRPANMSTPSSDHNSTSSPQPAKSDLDDNI